MDLTKQTVSLDTFARRLLATTCLTMAAGTAVQAGTVTESTDFDNSSPGFILPGGTTVVNGRVDCRFCGDDEDWFQFQGLLPGSSFTLTFENQPASFLRAFLDIFNSSGTILGEGAIFESGSRQFLGTVPTDGTLRVRIGGIEEGGGAYSVSLNEVPEPATLAPAGLALAGALAWRRLQRNPKN